MGDAANNEREPGKYDWIIGIILMIVGSVLTNLGNNLMSLGHTEHRMEKKRCYSQSKSGSPTESISLAQEGYNLSPLQNQESSENMPASKIDSKPVHESYSEISQIESVKGQWTLESNDRVPEMKLKEKPSYNGNQIL